MQRFLKARKMINLDEKMTFFFFFFFAQNLDCEYTLNRLIEAILTSTHKLCFRANIRK